MLANFIPNCLLVNIHCIGIVLSFHCFFVRYFRRIKLVDDALTLTMASEKLTDVSLDETLIWPGYEKRVNVAREDYLAYSTYIMVIFSFLACIIMTSGFY